MLKTIAQQIPPIARLVRQRDVLLSEVASLRKPVESAPSAADQTEASSDTAYSAMSIGPVRDHFNSPIIPQEYLAMSRDVKIRADAAIDDLPLPPTDRREGYHGQRHFEHWLSGRRDAQYVIAAAGELPPNPTILEFGGATGRVIRHMRQLAGRSRNLLADANPQHVIWTNTHLAPFVTAFQTRYQPPFPLPDYSVDLAMAFSVFTHIYEYETAWLLELRRVLKPGGLVYVTIHDDVTWDTIEQSVFHPWFTSLPAYERLKKEFPKLEGRLLFSHSRNDYGSNVFHSQSYIRSLWSNFFVVEAIHSLRHDHQAAVVMRASLDKEGVVRASDRRSAR